MAKPPFSSDHDSPQGWHSTREEDPKGNSNIAPAPDYGPSPTRQQAASRPPMPSATPRMGPNLAPLPSSQQPVQQGPNLSAPKVTANNKASDKSGQDTIPHRTSSPTASPESTNSAQDVNAGKPQPKKPKNQRKPGRRGAHKVIADGANFAIDKKPGPIVPKGTIAGNALVLVIAIMSFLAALTVAAVTIISDATRDWQSEIGRGATIQIRQIDGVDIEGELAKAVTIARNTAGITSATALSTGASNALLEPWLGLNLVFDDLPVPRLIELTIDDPSQVDFAALSKALQQQIKGAILDNHRFWVERLRSMAETAILIGFTILALVLAATVLTVIFATRSAMAGNRETIEVLHFVGASNKFIAAEFQQKFFTLGLKGSMAGGGTAMLVFLILQFLIRQDEGSATLDQMQALLGVVELGYAAYVGTLVLVILIAIFTAVTTGLTVMKTLSKLS